MGIMSLKSRVSEIIIEIIGRDQLSNVKMGAAMKVDKNTIDN